jgi:hypothetical protein
MKVNSRIRPLKAGNFGLCNARHQKRGRLLQWMLYNQRMALAGTGIAEFR